MKLEITLTLPDEPQDHQLPLFHFVMDKLKAEVEKHGLKEALHVHRAAFDLHMHEVKKDV